MRAVVVAPGSVFGRWVVLAEAAKSSGHRRVHCECSCGRHGVVQLSHLRSRASLSCGCLRAEQLAEANTTHGLSQHPLYFVWCDMRHRCTRPTHQAFAYYGGRGIRVCPQWESFEVFLADMGPGYREGLTLDRFPNNDGDYEPGNCRWATRLEQANNRRPRRRVS